jgi:hypothetical protein
MSFNHRRAAYQYNDNGPEDQADDVGAKGRQNKPPETYTLTDMAEEILSQIDNGAERR